MFPPFLASWLGWNRTILRWAPPAPATHRRPRLGVEFLEHRLALAGFSLSNGPGESTLTVRVDGYGAFGSSVGVDSGDLLYHPVGASRSGPTTFESGVAVRFPANREGPAVTVFLTAGDIGGSGNLGPVAVSGTSTSASSTFTFGGLTFTLTQKLVPLLQDGVPTGTALVQTYDVTNTTSERLDFSLFRYFDGDLRFNGDITDGGGRLILNGTEILFETDTAAGTGSASTFIGISATGGIIPTVGRYEVDSYSGLRDRIISGLLLRDSIRGDGSDADEFIDVNRGYDVTLMFRNDFSLAGGESATYLTQTLAGTGAPEVVRPPVDPPPVDPPPHPVDPPPPPVNPPPVTPPPVSTPTPTVIVPVLAADSTLPQLGIALVQGEPVARAATARGEDGTSIVLALSVGRLRLQTDFTPPNFLTPRVGNVTAIATSSEAVIVGTGSIAGVVFEDTNGNGIQNGSEVGLAGQTVYLDLNNDGVYQETEPATITNSKGEYQFQSLRLDTYVVRQVQWAHLEQTFPVITPASGVTEKGGHLVALSPSNSAIREKNFGAIQLNVIRRPAKPARPARPAVTEPTPSPSTPATRPETPQGKCDDDQVRDQIFQQPLREHDMEVVVPPPGEADQAFLSDDDEGGEFILETPFPWKPLALSGAAVLFWVQLAGHRELKEERQTRRWLKEESEEPD